MKLLLLIALSVSSISFGQTTLYSNNFEGAPGVNLNTTTMGGTATGDNPWIINNTYAGGSGSFFCSALGITLPFTVPAAPSQPAGITNSPNSTYLHVTPQIAIAGGGTLPCASYVAADGFCLFGGQSTFTSLSSDLSTLGYDSVEMDLWWMCGGSTAYYGEMYYSTNSGSTWLPVTCPVTTSTQWRSQLTWVNSVVTNSNWANQATLRFAYRFISGATSTGSELDPGFALDDIDVIGYTLCSATSGSLTATACNAYTSPSGNYTWTASGNYTDTLVNAAGCDSIVNVSLTINTVNSAVSQAGANLVAAAGASATYLWLDCLNGYAVIPGQTAATFTPTVNGIYAAQVTQNGCVDTSACVAVGNIGIDEFTQQGCKLYPNPSTGSITIEQELNATRLMIYAMDGKEVYTCPLSSSKQTLDLDLLSGMYIIHIQIGEGALVQRLVIR
ncbi:MAG: hypothetical protein A3D92_22455 [Bacteroidetes bacterium RIFCSPHIGHO2_02_FULL_44_7]|nr:MAG: hypothetical protein A3D92_22455 [Bacteroidetes bacterium RIFCSPHIGHO2_02_FULL_44_7]